MPTEQDHLKLLRRVEALEREVHELKNTHLMYLDEPSGLPIFTTFKKAREMDQERLLRKAITMENDQ